MLSTLPGSLLNNVDGDFPGWTKLVETIKLFHSKFNKVNKYYPITLIKYDESDEFDEFVNYCLISMIDIRRRRKIKLRFKEIMLNNCITRCLLI